MVQQTLDQVPVREKNQTAIIIAHRLSTIRHCDVICVLDGGRIIESGTHDDLLEKKGAYMRFLLEQEQESERGS